MNTEQLIRELPKGLIKWYEFHKGSRALYVTAGLEEFEPLADALKESGLQVEVCSLYDVAETDGREAYDYIVLVGALERSNAPIELLRILRGKLSTVGRLLLGVDNRLGIRYFCGERDRFTQRNFDGIENYFKVTEADRKQLSGRAYARAEILQFLEQAGFSQYRFYSVFPALSKPQVLYAEDYLPEEVLDVRITPHYDNPDTVFMEEERLYAALIENGMFHAMANGYLIECIMDGVLSNMKQVTVSMDRGPENALVTMIRRDGTVAKKAIHPEGFDKLQALMENTDYLRAQGVPMVEASLEKDAFVMPYIQAETATEYFRRLLRTDRILFGQELANWWNIIVKSSEHVPYDEVDWERFEPGWERRKPDDPTRYKWRDIAFGSVDEQENLGVILKRGYIDLVCLNCFHTEEGFVFYDQELYMENLPAKAILYRTIELIYRGYTELEAILPKAKLMEQYRLLEYQDLWLRLCNSFLDDLRNDKQLAAFYKQHRRDGGVMNSNRQKMNFSADEYDRLFCDIFRGVEGRRLYLFGSGSFTKRFLSRFGKEYEIAGILDNSEDKWGDKLEDIVIMSPRVLEALDPDSYKVIICIKNYTAVMKQLQTMGVKDYAIFDSNLKFPRKEKPLQVAEKNETEVPKKYHVGYIAGVFDLFHMGHLNMFKRAKEQCDYLIVGVVSDEQVINTKKTTPYIPFEERMEIVGACRYVDEVVEIPTAYAGTEEAYRRYQFDVQFSGSDYADDPVWLAKQAYLRKQGSDLVFFPYTESTSSTKLKEMIRKKLI